MKINTQKYQCKIVLASVIILCAIITFKFFGLYKKYRDLNTITKNVSGQLENLQVIKTQLQWEYLNRYNIDGMSIPFDFTVMTKDGANMILFDRINGKPRVVIYYPANGCQLCIEQELQIINKLDVKFSKEDIILLGNYTNIRNLYVFVKSNKIKYDVFSANAESFIPGANIINSSIVFVVDETMKVKYSHIQNKSLPDISKEYYNMIYNKLYVN